MSLSKTSAQGVDLDDLEQHVVAIPKRNGDPLAELARIVGRDLGRLGGRQQSAPATPVQSSVPEGSFGEDEPHVEAGPALESDALVDQALDGRGVEPVADTSDAALARRASKKRSLASPGALALSVSLVLITVGLGVGMVLRVGPFSGLGGKTPVAKAGDAPQQAQIAAGDQTPSQSAFGAAGTSAKPDQTADVAIVTTAAPPRPAATLMLPIVAANPPPDPPKPAAESPVFGTPSVKPNEMIISKGKADSLSPTKSRTLASTDTAALVRAKPSRDGTNAAGASSFSIQLASSASKNEARATLSRLQKQFPDMLGGASIRRAEGGRSGVFFRVQSGPLSRNAADKACSRLKASGEACIVVRG